MARAKRLNCRHSPRCRKFPRYLRAIFGDMTTPRGCLRTLTQTLMRLARRGDVEALREYLSSHMFMAAFSGLDPNRRQSAMRCYGRAEALCEARARHPLVQPKPIDA